MYIRRGRYRLPAMAAILILALALRLAPLGRDRFMEDEALYAAWGLQIATGADPKLDYEPVDKPPLYPYTLALAFTAWRLPPAGFLAGGQGGGESVADHTLAATRQMETAARLPSLLASIAGVVLLYALGRRLYRDEGVGLLAALLLALSPFDVLFASTVYTDPLLVALVLGALLAATAGRPGAAGLLAGLAWATKQQALLFLPLLLGVLLLGRRGRQCDPRTRTAPPRLAGGPSAGSRARPAWRKARGWLVSAWSRPWVRLALGLAAVAVGVAWWDASRLQRPGYLVQSLISYGGLEPAAPGTLAERAAAWLRLAGLFWASPWVNALLGAALVAWAAFSLFRLRSNRQHAFTGHENLCGSNDLTRSAGSRGIPPAMDPTVAHAAAAGGTDFSRSGQTRRVTSLLPSGAVPSAAAIPQLRTTSAAGDNLDPLMANQGYPAAVKGSTESYTRRPRAWVLDLALLDYLILFLAIHWLWRFQVWDRYLLGLVPIAALLAARSLVGLGRALPCARWRTAYGIALPLLLLSLLAGPLNGALHGALPAGGDHGAYDGLDRLAAAVRAEVPPGGVLYHHWLGYHYRFYLYGAPLRLHWYPDATDLVRDAVQYRREPRYIAFPSFRDGAPMRAALAEAGIRLLPVYEANRRDGSTSFRLYRMDGPGESYQMRDASRAQLAQHHHLRQARLSADR